MEDVRALGGLPGPPGGSLGASWGPLGALLDPLGGLLGRLGAIVEASWADLERRKSEKARTLKSCINCRTSMSFASWAPLGKGLGALLGRFGGLLGRLEAI